MLTQREAIRYLLRRGLLSERQVVDGEVTLADASRRNRNFKVMLAHGTSYLLKQALTSGGAATLAHEAAIYTLLERAGLNGLSPHGPSALREQSRATPARKPRVRALSEYVPRCFGHDADAGVLILELLPDAETLGEYHGRRGHSAPALAATLGDALGAVHTARWGPSEESVSGALAGPMEQAWVLSLHQPRLGMLREISGANVEFIQLLQGADELCQRLDALRDDWQATALIHFDLKWDNCIVAASPARGRRRMQVVDWELAGWGDPSWDVGSIFAEYLSFWLLSIPLTGEDPPDRFLELARYPLVEMQPAIRAFWHAYVTRVGLAGHAANHHLSRAARFAAARLVHAGFEQLQTSSQLTPTVAYMAQLALNVLRRPVEAAVLLLGIPPEFGFPTESGFAPESGGM